MLKKLQANWKEKKIMMWMLMWFNWRIATINTTLQLLDIYIYIYQSISYM